jgi:hypothetical protein
MTGTGVGRTTGSGESVGRGVRVGTDPGGRKVAVGISGTGQVGEGGSEEAVGCGSGD